MNMNKNLIPILKDFALRIVRFVIAFAFLALVMTFIAA